MSTTSAVESRKAWSDLLESNSFGESCYANLKQQDLLKEDEYRAISAYYQQRHQAILQSLAKEEIYPNSSELPSLNECWSCKEPVVNNEEKNCLHCGAPIEGPTVKKLRYLTHFINEIESHVNAGRLRLADSHSINAIIRDRIKAVRGNLERGRILTAIAVEPGTHEDRERAPRRNLMEIVLEPHNIQWLLVLGGGLFVVGLVVWLATLGVFKNPVFVAACLGAGNGLLLAGGWALMLKTRFQMAGRALTLLACLVMPLNLWFYHTHNLITLEGHLWVAALVICVLYAASARVLRDSLFVYVFVGGVALTGLLLLADLGKFWEIAAPSTMLVIMGLAAMHAERAFPESEEGPFTRRRFGLAFFWSGHLLIAAGLVLLLGAFVAGGWLYEPIFHHWYEIRGAAQPPVVTELWGKLLALVLVSAGIYAYLYSDLIARRIGVCVYGAAFLFLWAEVLILDILGLTVGLEIVLATLALTSLIANLTQMRMADGERRSLVRAFPILGLMLGLTPVLFGVLLHFRATSLLKGPWPYAMNWGYVGAMALTIATCRASAYLYRRSMPWLAAIYFFGAAAATLVGAAGLLSVLGLKSWEAQAPWLMAIPILYMIAARLYQGHASEKPMVWLGHTATAVMLLSSLGAAVKSFGLLEPVQSETLNLTLALFFAEATVFYILAACFRRRGINIYLATAMACAAVWQLLSYLAVGAEFYTLTFALLGLAFLIVYRFAILDRLAPSGMSLATFQSANALLSLSFMAAGLLFLSRLLTGALRARADWTMFWLLVALVVIACTATILVREQSWRRWYVTMAVTESVLALLVIHVLIHLSPWQKVELFSVALGIMALAIGHVGWYREQGQESESDMVSFSLFMGSLLTGLPLAIAVLVYRSRGEFSIIDELGLLAAGIIMLATGYMLKLKSTTLTGASLTGLYLFGLLLFFNWQAIQTAALVMTIGGAGIFGVGLLLSVYRDRLLSLPQKIKRREGVFQVLGWR